MVTTFSPSLLSAAMSWTPRNLAAMTGRRERVGGQEYDILAGWRDGLVLRRGSRPAVGPEQWPGFDTEMPECGAHSSRFLEILQLRFPHRRYLLTDDGRRQ